MGTQNNTLKERNSELSLGTKVLLIIGGCWAASSTVGLVMWACGFSLVSSTIWGIVFTIGSLLLSHYKKTEVRFAFAVPFYIAGMSMLCSGIIGWLEFSCVALLSFLAIPTLFLSGTPILKHLAIAQFFWIMPFWFLGASSHDFFRTYHMIIAIIAVALYVITIIKEEGIREVAYLAKELRALRFVLLVLAIGLFIWLDFGFIDHSNGVMSLIMSLILLPLTFLAADRVGLTLSILYLIYALILFYYNAELTLLNKSLILMVNGLTFLLIFYGIKKVSRK